LPDMKSNQTVMYLPDPDAGYCPFMVAVHRSRCDWIPVFTAGIKPVDSRGRGIVVDYNVPVECGGVVVSPGDLIVADFDGIIAIQAEKVDEAIRLATDKVERENSTREELLQGAYLRDVYNKYGVL